MDIENAEPKKTRKRRRRRTVAPTAVIEKLDPRSAVAQVRKAFRKGQRLSLLMGFVMGSIPIGSYLIVHRAAATAPWLWIIAIGGLGYSSLSVYQWAFQAFGGKTKAACFVLLCEGIVTFVPIVPLALYFLGVLCAVNTVAAAVGFQTVAEPTVPAPAALSPGLTLGLSR